MRSHLTLCPNTHGKVTFNLLKHEREVLPTTARGSTSCHSWSCCWSCSSPSSPAWPTTRSTSPSSSQTGTWTLTTKIWLFFLRGLKGPCHTIKVTKNVIWYFQKLRVHLVVDYADTCWNSRWLRGHNVSVATDYADTMSISCWLCGQGVGEVVDYADTIMTMQTLSEKLWRLLTDFKGTIRQKRYLVCVYTPTSNN